MQTHGTETIPLIVTPEELDVLILVVDNARKQYALDDEEEERMARIHQALYDARQWLEEK